MKAYLLERHGGLETLRPREVPEPVPSADQVVVRVEAIGLNWAEVQSRRGLYGWAPPLPYVLGMEATGEIVAVGAAAGGRALGERVIVGTQYGCYAEQIAIPARLARPALAGYTVEENAAFAVNYLTAWVALFEMARLRPEDRVLIDAAAGGVGTAAVQLASHFGARVYGLAGNDEKVERLRGLGVAAAVNYRDPGYEAKLRAAIGGSGVEVVLALVAGEAFRAKLRLLAPFGRIVVVGVAGLAFRKWNPLSWWRTWRDLPRADLRRLFVGSHGVMATHIGYLLADAERLGVVWKRLTAFVERHGIRPIVGATFPFERMVDAHALMESRRSVGKIVVRV